MAERRLSASLLLCLAAALAAPGCDEGVDPGPAPLEPAAGDVSPDDGLDRSAATLVAPAEGAGGSARPGVQGSKLLGQDELDAAAERSIDAEKFDEELSRLIAEIEGGRR